MFKLRILPVLLLGIMLIASCAMNIGELDSQADINDVLVSQEAEINSQAESRGAPPASKVVTVTQMKTMRIYKPSINNTLNGIQNGSLSYNYDDGAYKGTLRSNKVVVKGGQNDGNFVIFKLEITYSGTVHLYVPAEKNVTVTKMKTMRIYKPGINYTLNGIQNGSQSYNYDDGTYAGTLRSNKVVVKGGQNDGNFVIFQLEITYAGQAYLKL